jgi:hypothetical protein
LRIAVLALEGLFDTGLAVALDALALANKFSAQTMGGAPYFDVSLVGMRKTVRSGHGLSVPVRPVTPDLKPDWVIVPALAAGTPEVLGSSAWAGRCAEGSGATSEVARGGRADRRVLHRDVPAGGNRAAR